VALIEHLHALHKGDRVLVVLAAGEPLVPDLVSQWFDVKFVEMLKVALQHGKIPIHVRGDTRCTVV
tara:strand:- start:3104 stop:3301 length:198 start_codon:yes stop_codon:yes gene_type:complete